MSNEIADALRRFADQIERGDAVPGASEACVVLANEAGLTSATYIGRKVPSRDAGIFLLASGSQRFIAGMPAVAPAAPAPMGSHFGATHRSTH